MTNNVTVAAYATSIDGVGPVIEYQRHPTKWEQVEKVVETLMREAKTKTCPICFDDLRPNV